MEIAVLGGGMVGSLIATELSKDYHITVIDNEPRNLEGVKSKIMDVNPYFIEEYKLASPNYSMKDISKIFNYLLEADKRAKGIDFDSTNYHAISSELIYKIFNSN